MKIDVTKIDGYDSMSAEEKLAALEGFEIEDNTSTLETQNAKLKEALNKASGEASKYKKDLQARLTEEEKNKAEQEEFVNRLKEQNEMLLREKNVATLTNGFSVAGNRAEELAKAFLDNDANNFVSAFAKFVEEHDKELKAEAMKGTPRPNGGSNPDAEKQMTKEEFNKLGYAELVKLQEENPELYEQLNA